MRKYLTVASAMAVGMVIGGFAVQGLHAQTKPPIYYVAEIDTAEGALTARDEASEFRT